jgi:hypothetical protein
VWAWVGGGGGVMEQSWQSLVPFTSRFSNLFLRQWRITYRGRCCRLRSTAGQPIASSSSMEPDCSFPYSTELTVHCVAASSLQSTSKAILWLPQNVHTGSGVHPTSLIIAHTTIIQSNSAHLYFNSHCCIYMCAACFGLYLGHPQACQ